MKIIEYLSPGDSYAAGGCQVLRRYRSASSKPIRETARETKIIVETSLN